MQILAGWPGLAGPVTPSLSDLLPTKLGCTRCDQWLLFCSLWWRPDMMTHPGQVTITRPWFWSGDAPLRLCIHGPGLWQSGLMFPDLWAGPVWPGNEVNNKCGSQSACIHIISPRWFIVSALHFLYVITDNDSQCWVSARPASHHLPGPEFLNHKMRPATLRALSRSPVVFRCLWSNLHPDVNPGAPPLVCCDVCDPRCIHGFTSLVTPARCRLLSGHSPC